LRVRDGIAGFFPLFFTALLRSDKSPGNFHNRADLLCFARTSFDGAMLAVFPEIFVKAEVEEK
jgi:hypothetical protein